MSNDVFEAQILADKLSKLNNSQQSIESLSRWCITYRKKAKQIVETWDKLFSSSQKEQCVSFLYLANDILQNSRRKGSEFVNEFWKVLPGALKHVYDHGDDSGKKAVTRLVDIWEERKVFGSRGQSLKDEMLGKNPPPLSSSNGLPLSSSNGKSSNPIKIVKRDAHSVRIKLAVGGVPEKIITAFQSVLDEHLSEDSALNNCSSATHHLNQIEEDFSTSLAQGCQPRSALLDDLQEQEKLIQHCIGQLENVEATRASLVSLLVEALQDQESKLEFVRNQLQIARAQIELASNVRKRLTLTPVPGPLAATNDLFPEVTHVIETKLSSVQSITISSQSPLVPAMASFGGLKTSEEENKRAAAAAVAAKLAASTSSAQMLTSVLSSLVAEEAASMNNSLKSSGFASLPIFSPEKRQKLEKPMPVSEVSSSDAVSSSFVTSMPQQQLTSGALSQSANVQPVTQANQIQASFAPPPPPAAPSPATPVNQYAQSGALMGVLPYGFGTYPLPPPPPLPAHIAMGLTRPTPQPSQHQQQQSQPTSGGYYRPPGIGFYGQGQQSTPPPPVPRQ